MNWLNQLLIVSLRADFLCSLKINQTNSNNIDVQQKRLVDLMNTFRLPEKTQRLEKTFMARTQQ